MNIKKDIRFRVYITYSGICLFGIAILARIIMIQVKEGPALVGIAKEMRTRTTPLQAERGNIYTESGLLLCSSLPQFDVHVDFSVIKQKLFDKNIDSLSVSLSRLFNDKTPQQYKKELMDAYGNSDQYYLLRKNLSYNEYDAIKSFPIFNKGKNSGGFIEDPRVKRCNPFGMLAYRTIGLWRENSKTVGLEAAYDSVLTGTNGSRMEEKIAGNTWAPIDGSELEPQDGRDLVSTIDMEVQDVAETAMETVLQKYDCAYGTCIVMEVKTGKIRSIVNLGRQEDGSYWEDLNYALYPTEPGSTFKLVTLLSLLNDKCVTINDIVDAEGGAIRFGDRTMHDTHLGLHAVPVWKAYALSSNAAMAKLAYTYYSKQPQKYTDHLHSLCLDMRTGIDITGERKPFVKTPKDVNWSGTTLPWMATGYEVMITPLHTCMLYNAIANGGKMMKPYLVSAIREYGKDVKIIQPKVLADSIASSAVISQVKYCLRAVVTEGTGKGIESPFYTIAGKTGTAQVADKGIKYTDGVYQGSFVGYFPADKPQYTICVVMRTRPNSNEYYGGTIAAPVFRMIADKMYATKIGSWDGQLNSIAKAGNNLLPTKQTTAANYNMLMQCVGKRSQLAYADAKTMVQITVDTNKKASVKTANIYNGLMPDLSGMNLKDAVYLLEREGLQVQVQGKGKVQVQSVPAGTKIIRGQNILLQLS